MRFIDLSGKQIGAWMVLKRMPSRRGRTMWLCRCKCGAEHQRPGSSIRKHKKGCWTCAAIGVNRTHGMTGTPEYKSWQAMLGRCRNPKDAAFPGYGGRGIFVCDRWLSFENFLVDMGSRPTGTSIDRLDNDKGYDPENCAWRTLKEQQNNRRSNRWVTFRGTAKTLAQWADELGICQYRISWRLRKGWSTERALTEPINVEYRTHRWD